MDLQYILKEAASIVRDTASYIFDEFGRVERSEIDVKELNSLVSRVDLEAERRLAKGLGALLPNSGFITEEKTVSTDYRNWMWVIDPLDGTTNYLRSLPVYAVSVALKNEEGTQLGIVMDIARRECYTATRGEGAFCNHEPISVSNTNLLTEAMVASGFPYDREKELEELMTRLKRVLKNVRGFRRYGSAAIDLAWVACGRFDAYYETKLNPWDVAAGALIVEEAGGKVSDFDGLPGDHDGKEILASNAILHDAIRKLMN